MPRPRTTCVLRRRAYDAALTLATLVVLSCTAVLVRAEDCGAPFAGDGESGFRAAVFLQERDCTSNLAFLQLLARSELSGRFTVVVYDVGGGGSVNGTAARLRGQDLPFRAIAAPRGSLAALRRMGYHATPVLVLLGPGDRVHMATAAPHTPDEMRTLASALELLTPARNRSPEVR